MGRGNDWSETSLVGEQYGRRSVYRRIVQVGEKSRSEKSPDRRKVQIGEKSRSEKSPDRRKVQIGEKSRSEKSPDRRTVQVGEQSWSRTLNLATSQLRNLGYHSAT
jgi:hypothetical protein